MMPFTIEEYAEDVLHWATPELLRALARRLEDDPLMILYVQVPPDMAAEYLADEVQAGEILPTSIKGQYVNKGSSDHSMAIRKGLMPDAPIAPLPTDDWLDIGPLSDRDASRCIKWTRWALVDMQGSVILAMQYATQRDALAHKAEFETSTGRKLIALKGQTLYSAHRHYHVYVPA
jgi:hypothetical protein